MYTDNDANRKVPSADWRVVPSDDNNLAFGGFPLIHFSNVIEDRIVMAWDP